MKFTCDKCSKKYAISDEKLKEYGENFRIRCKNCKHIIVISNPIFKKEEPREWYVYVKGNQIGPLTYKDVKAYIEGGEVNFSSLVWKIGMDEWRQAQFITELKSLLKLPMKTSQRRANQSKKLSEIYQQAKSAEVSSENAPSINPGAFDEEVRTIAYSDDMAQSIKDQVIASQNADQNETFDQQEDNSFQEDNNKNLEEDKNQNEIVDNKDSQKDDKIDTQEENKDLSNVVEEESSIYANDFFNSEFEEKKESKDARMLRSLTGDSKMGATGIFVMYNQKRRRERWLYLTGVLIILIIAAILVNYYMGKKPSIKIVEKKVVEEKVVEKEVVKEKIKYVDVGNNSNGKTIRKKVKTNNNDQNGKEKKIEDKNSSLYNIGPKIDTKRVALKKSKNSVYSSNSKNKDYVKAVTDKIEIRKKGIFNCYRKALKSEPDLKVKVKFKLTISSSGRVNGLEKTYRPSSIKNTPFDTCMMKKIKSWKFPINPDGGATEFSFKLALQAQ